MADVTATPPLTPHVRPTNLIVELKGRLFEGRQAREWFAEFGAPAANVLKKLNDEIAELESAIAILDAAFFPERAMVEAAKS